MSAWQKRDFRLRLTAHVVSSLGNTLVPVALSFAVLDLTRSAADLGLVLGAGAAAQLLFLLVGGLAADRFSRRVVMVAADAVRGTLQLILGLALILGHPAVLIIATLNFIGGGASAMFTPAATALTPALVKPEDLQQANALQQTGAALAGIAGPAIAGLLVVSVGSGWAIVADAATFFASLVLVMRIRFVHVPRMQATGWLRDLREGWAFFWSRKWFYSVVLGFSIFNFLFAAYNVLGPIASKEYYGGARTWAAASTALAIGSAIGGAAAVKLKPRHPLRGALALATLVDLAPLAFGLNFPVYGIIWHRGGFALGRRRGHNL